MPESHQASRDLPEPLRPPSDLGLEGLYYDGGLRSLAVDGRASRPPWAPPLDYVGLRNQISLGKGEAAVDFARFRVAAGRVTWLGVFYRSVDGKYGDRLNHSGVGVWMLEKDVLVASELLHGLSQLARAIATGDLQSAQQSGPDFAARYLPDYVQDAANLPAPLGGVPHQAPPIIDEVLVAAEGRSEEERWERAARQILRLTYLGERDRGAHHIILIGDPDDPTARHPRSQVQPTTPHLERDLFRAIPQALAGIGREAAELRRSGNAALARVAEQEQELHRLGAELAAARQEVARLEELAAPDAPARLLQHLVRTVDDLPAQFRMLEARVAEAAQARLVPHAPDPFHSNQLAPSWHNPLPPASPPDPHSGTSHPARRPWKWRRVHIVTAILAALAVLAAGAGMWFWMSSGDEHDASLRAWTSGIQGSVDRLTQPVVAPVERR